jgi:hypothetical protein
VSHQLSLAAIGSKRSFASLFRLSPTAMFRHIKTEKDEFSEEGRIEFFEFQWEREDDE